MSTEKTPLENENQPSCLAAVISIADYKHIWGLMNELNTIMWESYMIEGKGILDEQKGYKIMGLLEQWAERH